MSYDENSSKEHKRADVPREAEMEIYDSFGPELRKAFQEAHFNWSPSQAKTFMEERGYTEEYIIFLLKQSDAASKGLYGG